MTVARGGDQAIDQWLGPRAATSAQVRIALLKRRRSVWSLVVS
ncbi:hypothetical protein [Streptomyces sp. NBC_00690]|nr:hypothetical protein [Streptomyces sp. NBC_00690]